jgi:hypothetical protein
MYSARCDLEKKPFEKREAISRQAVKSRPWKAMLLEYYPMLWNVFKEGGKIKSRL